MENFLMGLALDIVLASAKGVFSAAWENSERTQRVARLLDLRLSVVGGAICIGVGVMLFLGSPKIGMTLAWIAIIAAYLLILGPTFVIAWTRMLKRADETPGRDKNECGTDTPGPPAH